jgi:hypothetical protein
VTHLAKPSSEPLGGRTNPERSAKWIWAGGTTEKSWGHPPSDPGNNMENHGKIQENHGKSMENHGKSMNINQTLMVDHDFPFDVLVAYAKIN